jgi:hypothetical protein
MDIRAIHAQQLQAIRRLQNAEACDNKAREWRDELARFRNNGWITREECLYYAADVARYIGPYFGVPGVQWFDRAIEPSEVAIEQRDDGTIGI